MDPLLRSFRASTWAALCLLASAVSAQAVRSTVSVTPQNGSGSSQVFTFVFSDSAGYQGILSGSHILFSSSGSSAYCWLLVGPSGVYLAPDNLSGAWPGVAYGSTDTVQNSQCIINGAGTTISGSGDTLTLNLSVTFLVAFAGTKTIYTDANSANSTVSVGTYTVTPTATDFTLSVSPSSQGVQAGQSVMYTVTASPLNGFNQNITPSFSTYLTGVSGTFNPTVITGGSGTSTLTVTALSSAPTANGPITVTGTSPSLTHSSTAQLSVTGAPPPPPPVRSTISVTPQNGSGSSQVFTFVFSDSAGYQGILSGSHILFSSSGSSAYCWLLVGPSGVYLAPDNLSGAWPGVAYGSSSTVQNSQCIINGAGTTISGSGDTLTLNLSVTFLVAFAGTKTIYTDANSANSTVSVGTYTVTPTATDFTLSVSPSSQGVQAGQSVMYTVTASPLNGFNQNITPSFSTYLTGVSGTFNPTVITGGSGTSTLTVTALSSAPTANGPITVTGTSPSLTHSSTAQLSVTGAPPPPPPTVSTISVTPQNGSGSSQVFTFVFSDSAGYQGILSGSHILFSSSGSSAYCWLLVGPSGVYLAPDNLSGAWPGVAYGSSSTVQNSQCVINGAGTTISGSGDNLTLNLSVSFLAAFAGTKTIYTDVNSSHSNISVGTYTVQ